MSEKCCECDRVSRNLTVDGRCLDCFCRASVSTDQERIAELEAQKSILNDTIAHAFGRIEGLESLVVELKLKLVAKEKQ